MAITFNIPEAVIKEAAESAARAAVADAFARMYPIPALGDVHAERLRQDEKWGEQNHPDGTGPRSRPLHDWGISSARAETLATLFTDATDAAAKRGEVTWRHILLEEVFEALAEADPAKLRTELIQVAAVATQWAEAIDRREDAQ